MQDTIYETQLLNCHFLVHKASHICFIISEESTSTPTGGTGGMCMHACASMYLYRYENIMQIVRIRKKNLLVIRIPYYCSPYYFKQKNV